MWGWVLFWWLTLDAAIVARVWWVNRERKPVAPLVFPPVVVLPFTPRKPYRK